MLRSQRCFVGFSVAGSKLVNSVVGVPSVGFCAAARRPLPRVASPSHLGVETRLWAVRGPGEKPGSFVGLGLLDRGVLPNKAGRRWLSSTTKGKTPPVKEEEPVAAPKAEEQEAAGKVSTLKMVLRQYGPVAIVTYLGIYVTTLGVIFAAIEAGVNPFEYGVNSGSLVEKVTDFLDQYSWAAPVVDLIHKNPHVGNFVMAWVLTKFTEPARAVLTLAVVPRIARALGRVPGK